MTKTQRAAMQQALEALELTKSYGNTFGYRRNERNPYEVICDALDSIRAALAEPEPEPVALKMSDLPMSGGIDSRVEFKNRRGPVRVMVTGDEIYTVAQPARQPLTDEEIVYAVRDTSLDWHTFFDNLCKKAGWSLDDGALNRYVTLIRAIESARDINEAK